MELSAVVIPTNAREEAQLLANLKLWTRSDCQPQVFPEPAQKLIVAMNNESGREASQNIHDHFHQLGLDTYFTGIETIYLDLKGARDAYIRDFTEEVGDEGYKSGPNNQFFEIMRHCTGREEAVFLMESDCIPVRPNWLRDLAKITSWAEPFFVIGSLYRGAANLRRYARHINGNAIYGCGETGFSQFLEFWETKLQEFILAGNKRLAYDCALELAWAQMETDDEARYYFHSFGHMIRPTGYIQNISHDDDLIKPDPNMVANALNQGAGIIHNSVLANAVITNVDSHIPIPKWPLQTKSIPPSYGLRNVRKENGRFVVSGSRSENYVTGVFNSEVKTGDNAECTILINSRHRSSLYLGLLRHGDTQFEGTYKIVDIKAGLNSVTVSHIFTRFHKRIRVQFASNDGRPMEFSIDNISHSIAGLKAP